MASTSCFSDLMAMSISDVKLLHISLDLGKEPIN